MEKISQVDMVEARRFLQNGLAKIHVVATGKAPTSGWSSIRLAPTYYSVPPADGIWEFSLIGDPPSGMVLQVLTPVCAQGMYAAPDWMKGVSVNGVVAPMSESELTTARGNNFLSMYKARLEQNSHVIVREPLAHYDDSFNAIGLCGGFSIKMKKLSHDLTLIVEGPDEGKIRECIAQATGIGLIAAIIAVYATGGGALSAATAAFLSSIEGCLGNSFSVRIDDEQHWVEWCT
jgi:hypothetical protein